MSPRFTARLRALAILLVVWGLPAVALACPVCFSTKSKDQEIAYLATTGFMTLLPLIGIATVVWWLRKRMRELARPLPPVSCDGPRSLSASVRAPR